MEVLSSSPLSVHSRWDLGPLQPSRSQRLDPLLTFSSSNNSTISSSFSFCSGISISHRHRPHNPLSFKCSRSRRKRRILPISAVFERFTERAIKVVIFSQREARALGKDMVFTQHLLLGLIGEDRDPNGLLGSGLKIDKAREVVRDIWSSDADDDDANASVSSTQRDGGAGATSSTDVPFSISTKRVFEAAVEYSRTMGHNFIAPEHIAVGLFTVDDGSATRVLKRYLLKFVDIWFLLSFLFFFVDDYLWEHTSFWILFYNCLNIRPCFFTLTMKKIDDCLFMKHLYIHTQTPSFLIMVL